MAELYYFYASLPSPTRLRFEDDHIAASMQLSQLSMWSLYSLSCGYNHLVDVGIKEAKANLSKLIAEVQSGKRIFVTNHGTRVAELVSAAPAVPTEESLGYGMLKDKIRLPAGWDSQRARRKASKEVIDLIGVNE